MFSKKYAVLVFVIVLVAALSVACGGGASSNNTGSGGGSAVNVTVTGSEFKFDPSTINAAPGQTVNVTYKNAGSVQHTFVIKEANNFKLTADPGQTVTGSFTAPTTAGSYTYFCDVAGHEDAGMKGTLVVK